MNIQIKKGYSIVEIVIYLAIFAAVSILVVNSFITILSSFHTTSVNRKLLESGTVSMERMSREVRQATSINASSTSDSLVLDVSGGTVSFKKEDGNLNFYSGNVLQGNLLDDSVSLTGLTFRNITTTESQAVKIEMTVEYREGTIVKSENFYDTIILRGSY